MDWLNQLLSGNQFLNGGLVLMAVGAAGAMARRVPGQLYRWVKSRCVLSLQIANEDRAFHWLSSWLAEQPYTKRSRRLAASSKYVGTEKYDHDNVGDWRVVFTPAPGSHLLWYRRRLVWLQREREQTAGKDGAASLSLQNKETYHITIFGRDQRILRELLTDAHNLAQVEYQKSASIYASMYGEWARIGPVSSRSLNSVILPAGQKEALLEDVQKFLQSKDWYRERGIPWRRGYLLHGAPGSGKSSVIGALAGTLNMNLYWLNLNSPGLSDERLVLLLMNMEEKSLLLLEDIDAVTIGRKHEKKEKKGDALTGISLSGLLNALDGVASRDGIVTFMTSNYPERLDAALTRNGRVDYRLKFSAPTDEQISAYIRHFYQLDKELNSLPNVESMAELQELCVKNPFIVPYGDRDN